MARPIRTRWRIEGTLLAESPLHVGAAAEAIETDLPLAVDGAGAFYVPGTSLAGALRDWQRAAFDGVDAFDIEQLWGYAPKRGDDPADGIASLVLVEDAKVRSELPFEIRDGVGIDRVEGRAADGIKYDRQVLPMGTELDFKMAVELPYLPGAWERRLKCQIDKAPGARKTSLEAKLQSLQRALHRTPGDVARIEAAFAHLVSALERGEVRLGGAKTRGAGRVRLKDCRLFKDDLNTRDGILALLAERSAPQNGLAALTMNNPQGFDPHVRPRLDIAIDWQPIGPVMVKADAEGVLVDMLPLVGATNGGVAPVIPGSSVKGALRSQAERIAATVLGACVDPDLPGRQRFLDHLKRCEIVEALFGAPGRRERRGDENDDPGEDESSRVKADESGGANAGCEPPLPGRSALSVEDCVAKAAITRESWFSLLDKEGGGDDKKQMTPLMELLSGEAETWQGFYPATHVAIDRWTGGAADGFLYSVLEPPAEFDWPAIEMRVDLDRLTDPEDARKQVDMSEQKKRWETDEEWRARVGRRTDEERENTHRAALALLLLTLRDLMGGRIPIGFGGNRGLGAIAVKNVSFKASQSVDSRIAELADRPLTAEDFKNADNPLKEVFKTLTDAWRDYRNAKAKESTEVER